MALCFNHLFLGEFVLHFDWFLIQSDICWGAQARETKPVIIVVLLQILKENTGTKIMYAKYIPIYPYCIHLWFLRISIENWECF